MTAGPARAAAPPRGARAGASAAEHFRLMADCAPVMIWVAGPDGRSVYFNRPWLDFTGRALDAELGHRWREGLHPDDAARCIATYDEAFSAMRAFEVEYRLRRGDGEYRWLLDKGVPLLTGAGLSGFVGSCLDITDRMRAEQEARKREEDFETLAENIPDVIARLDRGLAYRYVNRAAEPAFGRKPCELIGRRCGEAGLPAHVVGPMREAARRAFDSGEEQRFHYEEAGEPRRHFAGRVIPEAGDGGRVDAVLVIVCDETARAREDERRAELLERERSARANAESATLARDQFLAIVSHELRSPLNGIKSWTHVLQNLLCDAEPSVRRALAGIMIGVDHQVRLIDDLLDVTRALSGNLGLLKQPMPLLPVLADAVESLRATALEKELRIVTDYAMGDREIHGDPDRIRQIFVNLVTNAVKFTQPGGTIRVSARPEGAMARVEVRDNGAGIPPDFLPYLFDPFRQADQGSASRRQEGLGLGLALVQRLAELHGGYVTCESDGVGRGATFRVYLPLRRDSGTRVAVGIQPAASTALPSLSGIRVLLIDDQREARESLAALLAQAGAAVNVAASGQEALAHLALGDEPESPEVVVCDIAMPDEDGYSTLKRIRRWESGDRSRGRRPAIALSAFTQREDRIRALSEGFQMHLTKPVAPAELVTVIASVARGMRM
ncbi:MAG TPA: ATP-binding protein [Usitatibacter sp.]|nr:ATP-binding protein [Usitatibacter sp.]